jgi:hypothetical protein
MSDFWRTCCNTVRGGEHRVECENWEPPLTVEEIRYLRTHVLNVQSLDIGRDYLEVWLKMHLPWPFHTTGETDGNRD